MASHTRILSKLQHVNSARLNVGIPERGLSALAGGLAAIYGLTRRDKAGIALALIGGAAIYRGLSGSCAVYSALGVNTTKQAGAKPRVPIHEQITIARSPEEVYHFWRNFENLPKFMHHLESVRVSGERHSRWVAKAPAGTTVEWDAEIIDDVEQQLIAWRTLPGAQVAHSGEVQFQAAPDGQSTIVAVHMAYEPPAGPAGVVLAKLFGEEPSIQIRSDLQRLKALLEAGLPASATGVQASADVAPKPDQLGPRSTVTKALEDTFPASDPIAVTQTRDEEQNPPSEEQAIGLGKRIY